MTAEKTSKHISGLTPEEFKSIVGSDKDGYSPENDRPRAKQRYVLRLTAHFTHYDPDHGELLWREFPKDKIVTDPDTIKWLEARAAPVERIEINPH